MLFLFGNAFLQLIYIMKYIIRVDADIGEIDEKKFQNSILSVPYVKAETVTCE